MAEVLMEFANEFVTADGTDYEARACGREREDGLWEGWVEFTPKAGGTALRTGRETTQPNEKDIRYWASGLTGPYLEGALSRAEQPDTPVRAPRVAQAAAFDGPAPSHARATPPGAGAGAKNSAATTSRAILDPFEVYGEGDGMLARQLGALDENQLHNIIRVHRLSDESADELRARSRTQLVGTIVAAVERRLGR